MFALGKYVELVNAYGRNPKTKAEVIDLLARDQDFMVAATGQYTNMSDMKKHFPAGTIFNIRYKNDTQIYVYDTSKPVKVKAPKA